MSSKIKASRWPCSLGTYPEAYVTARSRSRLSYEGAGRGLRNRSFTLAAQLRGCGAGLT